MGKITDIAQYLRRLVNGLQMRVDGVGVEDLSARGVLQQMGLRVTADALCEMSCGYADMGLIDKALEAVESAVAVQGDHPGARLQRGLMLARLGRYEAALEDFLVAVQSDQTRPVALSNTGAALGKLGRFEQAQACLEDALKETPGDPSALINMGAVLLGMRHYDQARDVLDQALKRNPRMAKGWFDLACVEAASGRGKQMLQALERALRLDIHIAEKVPTTGDFDDYREDQEMKALLEQFARDEQSGDTAV